MVGMEAKVRQSDERLGSDWVPQEAWGTEMEEEKNGSCQRMWHERFVTAKITL